MLRDQVCSLAKNNPRKALEKAWKITDPWYRAQAMSWIARFWEGDPMEVAKHAAKAAGLCEDEYQRTAVRAWEIAAIAERGKLAEARSVLKTALQKAGTVTPSASRAEALTLLLHAATRIDEKEVHQVAEVLHASCSANSHWRCKRAIKDCERILNGDEEPRPFFW
ncbi:MAG: hypothetical protein R6U98_27055 [Pirellulaceae bacterium]